MKLNLDDVGFRDIVRCIHGYGPGLLEQGLEYEVQVVVYDARNHNEQYGKRDSGLIVRPIVDDGLSSWPYIWSIDRFELVRKYHA